MPPLWTNVEDRRIRLARWSNLPCEGHGLARAILPAVVEQQAMCLNTFCEGVP